jgi:DNA-binding response OmpR family regulator
MTMNPHKILIVEDDSAVLGALLEVLRAHGYSAVGSTTGEFADRMLHSAQVDCVILDLGLPDMQGATLLQKIRGEMGFKGRIIVHTIRYLESSDQTALRRYADVVEMKNFSSIIKIVDQLNSWFKAA